MRRNRKKNDGKVILRSVPSPEVERRVVGLLSQLMKSTAPEKIRAGIANPPVVLAKRIRSEKGEKLVKALAQMGAKAVFVPLRPDEQEKLANGKLQPRVVEKPVEITPPPGRILKKWARRAIVALLVVAAIGYAVVENIPIFYPKGIFPVTHPPRTDFTEFHPVGASQPSLKTVHPLDMMDAMASRYRLPPDRRLTQVFELLTVYFEKMIGSSEATDRFGAGTIWSNGKTLVVQLMENNQLAAEIRMPLPISFSDFTAACSDWLSLMATAADSNPPAQAGDEEIPGMDTALADINRIDPRAILNGLGTLDDLSRSHGPQWSILKTAARGYSYLLMTLFPDRADGRDQLAAHGLSMLALSRWLAPEMDLSMEEALLAYQMGYTAHAGELIRNKSPYTANPSDRLLLAYMKRDARQLASARSRGDSLMGQYLSARLFREIGQIRSAEMASTSLENMHRDVFPAMVEAIHSGRREIADIASHRYPSVIVEALKEVSSGAANQTTPIPASTETVMPWHEFEALLNRTEPGPPEEGNIVSAALARHVYRVLYTGAVFLRFQLLLDRPEAAGAIAASLPSDAPLAMAMRAQLLAKSGQPGEAAALSARIVADSKTSARLALHAAQLLGERPDRLERIQDAVHRMDDRPDNRFFMASLCQRIWYGDMAEKFYTAGLRQHPHRFSAYRELARVTGNGLPLETALQTYDDVPALLIAAGDFYADRAAPEEAEKSLAYYTRADALAPEEDTPVLKLRRILYRFDRRAEAASVLKEKLDQNRVSGSAEFHIRLALTNTYLDLKRLEEAQAVIDPLVRKGGLEVKLVTIRANEIKGDFATAFAAYQETLQQFPNNRQVLAAVAGFNWRAGRFKVAADLIAGGRRVAGPGCEWYADAFASSLARAPEERMLSAVASLRNTGAESSEIRCLAFALEARREFSAAFALMNSLLSEGKPENLDLAARMAVLLKNWKGENADDEFLRGHLPTPLQPVQAAVLYRYGLFKTILEQLAEPSAYPRDLRERVRLMYLSAWLGSGRKADGLDKRIIRHYRGSWLQRKKAQVTGRISPDPDHLAGRYLLRMISRDEFLERIDRPELRSQYPYYVGLSGRTIGSFSEAAAWYQLCRDSHVEEGIESGWSTNEMFWWAHLGARNRNRRLNADITDYYRSLIDN